MALSSFFWDQAQKIQKQLQELLEKSEADVGAQKPAEFEVSTEIHQMDEVRFALPSEEHRRVQTLFERLHPYFDAGVLFRTGKNSGWSPISAFEKAHCFELTPQEQKIEFEFPELTLVEVKKARSQNVINDLGLKESLNHDKITALVFRPHPQYLFLVLSELADPWLKLQIEKAQGTCLLALSDLQHTSGKSP